MSCHVGENTNIPCNDYSPTSYSINKNKSLYLHLIASTFRSPISVLQGKCLYVLLPYMLKYLFDRVIALFGLIVLSPLLIIVSLLILWKMPNGPILFRQKRVGQYAKLFTMIKFRTMYVEHNGACISIAGESRITPLGRILRKYKLDELPELWNVLVGDMSFVGPRPEVPGYADLLEGANREILKLKPGITGPATIKYRRIEELLAQQENPQEYNDKVIYPDKTKLNLEYYHHIHY